MGELFSRLGLRQKPADLGANVLCLVKKKAVEPFMTFSEVALKRRRSRAQMSGADFGGDQCTSWQYSSPASSGS
jgi:hypothetical protein